MRSHLTRHVFRQILANEPIVHRRCLRLQTRRSISSRAHLRSLAPHHGITVASQCQQKRGIFNFNIFSKRQETREADMEPGIDKMMELAKRERLRARMPPPEEVVLALRQLFDSKVRRLRVLTDTEAQLALQSLRYLLSLRDTPDEEGASSLHWPSPATCSKVAKALRLSHTSLTQTHVDLAGLLYENSNTLDALGYRRILLAYVATLCRMGQTSVAREAVLHYEQSALAVVTGEPVIQQQDPPDSDDPIDAGTGVEATHSSASATNHAWRTILRGFVQEDNEPQVQEILSVIEERNLVNSYVAGTMIDFHMKRGNVSEAQGWWMVFQRQTHHEPRHGIEAYFSDVLQKLLVWCLANKQLAMGHEIVRQVMASNPAKLSWDAVLVWAAGTKRSVDEIDRMMTVMEKSNADISDRSQWRIPDIATINGLVEFAISINDPYMAERFITLGRDRKIEPDARTLVLQMEYRLSVKDVDGALTAYKNLQSLDTSSNRDLPTVNRLIVALCQTSRHDFDTIMNVTADLSDRRARFEAPTVSALSILHLSRDEGDDVVDLLNTHAFHYSSLERKSIRDTILTFCIDPATPTSRSWEGYTILRTVFDELPRPERTDLMSSFLSRSRADMAVHVFQSMRMHTRLDTIPTTDTYAIAFLGFAKLQDLESLEVVHNLLKLDYNINPSTYLRNALMIAYTACGKPRNALTFWDEIVASREGPTYNSIGAALRACEKAHWGDVRAKEIWTMLRARNVDFDQNLWVAYVAALAGNGDVRLAIETLQEAVEKGEAEVDVFMLGSLYGATTRSVKQEDVEAFGKEKYPLMWRRLEELGIDEDEDGGKTFKIDRRIGP